MFHAPRLRRVLFACLVSTLAAAGCAKSGRSKSLFDFPPETQVVAEGRDAMKVEAPAAGKVYVYDVEGNRVVASTDVWRGQSISVNPSGNKVMLDGMYVFHLARFDPAHTHRIMFLGNAGERPWFARKDEPKPKAATAPVAAAKSEWPGGLNPVQRSLQRSTVVKMERGTFSQTFKKAGMVHVQDMATDRILTSRGVNAGDQLTLNVREGKLQVNTNVTINLPMDAGHVHAFRFDEKGRHAWDEFLQGPPQQGQAKGSAARPQAPQAKAPQAKAPQAKPAPGKPAEPDVGTPTRHTSARD